jgi:hypothetical protein
MPLMKRLLIPIAALCAVLAMAAPSAFASTTQASLVLDNLALNKNPQATLEKLKTMGVTMVKYAVYWNEYAPAADAATVPAADTTAAAYAAENQFGVIDEIDRDAAKLGIRVGLMVTSPAPRWAEGTGGTAKQYAAGTYKPSPADYQSFIEALGARYSGSTVVNGTKLPAITWWSVFNEPNYIPNLAPQTVGSSTYESADLYRGLVNAAFEGLRATGHGANTFIFGELAPRGIAGTKAGNAAGIKPVQFLASMYCVTTAGRRLTGAVAAANGCPSSAAAFKSAYPALFDASGVADHPYAQGTAPDVPTYDCSTGTKVCSNAKTKQSDPLWTDLASISHLENGLAKDLKAYGSSKKFSIWNTEYGYWAVPNAVDCHSVTEADCAIAATTAAYYDNWAEYLSYRNPRIASFGQYQLYEPTVGAWTDGLLTQSGAERTAYGPFEMPLFMPTTSAAKPGSLTVWGEVRAASFYRLTYAVAPDVKVQFKAKSGGWKTLKTVKIANAEGYFTTSASFGTSGTVRLAYTAGKLTTYSRTQAITVK